MAQKVNPKNLIDEILDGNWDTSSLELRQHDIARAANSVEWMIEPKFCLSFAPWPRQIEILTKLFEDYCPDCSDMSVVGDMWGMDLSEIRRKVMYLQYGKCPVCGKTRNDFRKSGQHQGVYELIGVAGQRCLSPYTKLSLANGEIITLEQAQVGDLIQDGNDYTKILKKLDSTQPGYFEILAQLPNGKITHFHCGHEHLWLTQRGTIVTTELRKTDLLIHKQGLCQILNIDKYKEKTRLIDIETESTTFNSSDGVHLHNSGKTALTAKIAAYLVHQYLCLDSVCSNHYGLPGTLLTGTFVAADVKQVQATTWGDFVATVKSSEWFKEYFAYLDTEKKRLGVKLYDFKETSLKFPIKRLEIEFGAGSMAGLRGRTRFFGSIDELGWFEQREGAKLRSGPEIYTALANSLRTVRSKCNGAWKQGRYNLPSAFMLNVSSPKAEDDPIMTKYAAAKADPKTYCFHYATWDINPDLDKAEMKSEMIKDPIKTMRDFGAQPGTGKDIFLPNIEIMYANIDDERRNAISYRNVVTEQTIKDTTYWSIKCVLESLALDKMTPCVVACDAGEVKNGYSVVIASLGREGQTILEAVLSVQPRAINQGTVARVNFPSISELIKEIGRIIHIEMIVYDRWQSTQAIQEFREMGYDARQISLKYPDFEEFKKRFLEGNISYPAPEVPFQTLMLEDVSDQTPVAQLLKQSRTVRDTGRSIVKPNVGDDDIFRGSVLADYVLHAFEQRFRRIGWGNRAYKSDELYIVKHTMSTAYKRGLGPTVKEDSGRGRFVTTRRRY